VTPRDVRAVESAYERLGGPTRLAPVATADPERHVLAGDILSQATTEPLAREIVGFLGANDTSEGLPRARIRGLPARRSRTKVSM
jgi:hypothetical protein